MVSQSTDGGATWTRHILYSGTQYGYVRAVASQPGDPDRVWALGYENGTYVLHKTVNGGTSWTQITPAGYTGTPYDLMVDPSNPDHLAAASSSGLFHSTDGGVSWTETGTGFGTVFDLFDSAGLSGLVLSTNAGIWIWESWSGTPVYYGDDPGTPSVNCVHDTPGSHLLAGTNGASVWSSFFGVSVEDPGYLPVPEVSSGVTVSPNPVPGVMMAVSFDLPQGGYTELGIYDLSGRLMNTAASGLMEAGGHEIMVEASELGAGVYFAVLTGPEGTVASRFTVTR